MWKGQGLEVGWGTPERNLVHSSHKLALPMQQCAMVGLNNPTHKECPNEMYVSKAQLSLLSCPHGDTEQTEHSPYM